MATCRKYCARSWPQLKLFKYGKYQGEYYGGQDACKTILFYLLTLLHLKPTL